MKDLETDRLRLRQPRKSDAAFIHRLMNDEGYLGQIGDRGVGTEQAARDYLRTSPIYQRDNGLGFNIVELRQTGEALGICGLVKRPDYDATDLGYALLTERSNNGFATEAAIRVARHAFQELGIADLLGITTLRNLASRRVLEKLGMTLESAGDDGGCVYRLTRADAKL